MRTRSPRAAPSSSCAMKREVRRIVLRYMSCWTSRSTATTTVLVMLSLTTTPVCSLQRRGPRASFLSLIASRPLRGLGGARALALDRLDPRDVATGLAHLQRVVELADRLLEAQLEQLLRQLFFLRLELVVGELADLRRLHAIPPHRDASRSWS